MSKLKKWWITTVEYGKELDKIAFLVPSLWGKGIVLGLDKIFEIIYRNMKNKKTKQ